MDTLHESLRRLVSPFRRAGLKMAADMEAAKQRTDLEKSLEGADGAALPTKEVREKGLSIQVVP